MRKFNTTVLVPLLFCALLTHGFAQGTAFNYQGRLNDNGVPATGIYDLRFTAYASLSAPTPLGSLTLNTVAVSNGLFSVTLDFGAGVFDGAQRWLEIAVRTNGGASFVPLDPRQAVTPVPYATHAATASNVVSGSVVTSLNNLRDNITLAAGANVTLTPSGNMLTIASAGAGGSGIWSVNNNNAYYTAGNVGIGASTPTEKLTIAGVPSYSTGLKLTGSADAGTGLALENTSAGGHKYSLFSGGTAVGVGPGGFGIYDDTVGAYRLAISASGNVGIGTATPQGLLDLLTGNGSDNSALFVRADPGIFGRGGIIHHQSSTYGWQELAQNTGGAIDGFLTYHYVNRTAPGTKLASDVLTLRANGNVGIGTSNPQATLDVLGTIHSAGAISSGGTLEIATQDALSIKGYQPFITMADANAFGLIRPPRRYLQVVEDDLHFLYQLPCNAFPCSTATDVHMTIRGNGNVGIGTVTPQAKLDVIGTTRTSVLTITGGADIAEPFKMSSGEIPKGSVVVIDEQNPGHLRLSTQAYDTRVAGVVSGANGIKPGISLHQEGAIEGGENVALSGRVYVQADAASGAIKPGDLLTTSATPGHAMKVTEHAKAQGAILGKAMSGLKEGKGMVLVLVTLQ